MSKFLRIDTGARVHSNSPNRGVWYATHGTCSYWTDDWDTLKSFGGDVTVTTPRGPVKTGGVPCCPHCGCPGFQDTFDIWIKGAQRFEADGHPHYVEFLLSRRNVCGKKDPKPWMARYETFVAATAVDKCERCARRGLSVPATANSGPYLLCAECRAIVDNLNDIDL